MKTNRCCSCLPLLLLLGGACLTTAVPVEIHYQGRLVDSGGVPVTGSVNLQLRIYGTAVGGSALYEESIDTVAVNNGVYAFTFGASGTHWVYQLETIATTNDVDLNYTKTLAHVPILDTLAVTDGSYSWTHLWGTSDPGIFDVTYFEDTRVITASYASPPFSPKQILAEYNYQEALSLTALLEGEPELYLELLVNGTPANTRTRLLAVPYALKARRSEDAQALAVQLQASQSDIAALAVQLQSSQAEITSLKAMQTEINQARDFALIPAGIFNMGDAFNEGQLDERPVHAVNLSAYYMGRTEVTKAKWDEVRVWAVDNGYTDLTTGDGKSPQRPVYNVSWFDAVKWLNAWSERDGLTPVYTVGGAVMRTGETAPAINYAASGYRLPTEAEWEKAARGGLVDQRFPWGNLINHEFANYMANGVYSYDSSPYTTFTYHPSYYDENIPYHSPVGDFTENGFGLFDIVGNVGEWCNDYYSSIYYSISPANDPTGPISDSWRVVRGGNFGVATPFSRSATRRQSLEDYRYHDVGFRPARSE